MTKTEKKPEEEAEAAGRNDTGDGANEGRHDDLDLVDVDRDPEGADGPQGAEGGRTRVQ